MHASAAILAFALTLALSAPVPLHAQEQDDQPRFRASVDVVTIAAVVRDKQGRVVPTLTKDDFTVLDGGQTRPIVEFQPDSNGPISVALLIDGSGSMRQSAAISKRVGETLLNLLNANNDDVALNELRYAAADDSASSRTTSPRLRTGLSEVETWGATSIYDAIAGAAGIVDEHTRKRRAVLVVTDGSDNWSTYSRRRSGLDCEHDRRADLRPGGDGEPDRARQTRRRSAASSVISHGPAAASISRSTPKHVRPWRSAASSRTCGISI